MSTYLFRLASFAYHRRRLVLGVWLVVLIGIIALASGLGGKENNNFTIPGTEAQNASERAVGQTAGPRRRIDPGRVRRAGRFERQRRRVPAAHRARPWRTCSKVPQVA